MQKDDLILRQAAIDVVNSVDNLDAKAKGGICIALMGLLPAQPEPNAGHWVDDGDWMYCSKCGIRASKVTLFKISLFGENTPNYCPNCGKDMRGAKVKCGDEDALQGGLISAT